MIVRIWKGVIHPGKEKEFERIWRRDALAFMKQQKDCLRTVTGKTEGKEPRYLMVSFWGSLDGVKKMAGENWNQPVVLPSEKHLIRESSVEHFEILDVQEHSG